MQPSRKRIAPETGAQMRERYAEGVPVSQILAEFGVTHGTLYFWVNGGPSAVNPRLPPLPRRRKRIGRRRRVSKDAIVARLWRAIEHQVCEIEERVARGLQTPEERDRDNRTIAMFGKTLRELPALDGMDKDPARTKPEASSDDDDGPRDMDEFRRDLARRIQEVVARRTADRSSEPSER